MFVAACVLSLTIAGWVCLPKALAAINAEEPQERYVVNETRGEETGIIAAEERPDNTDIINQLIAQKDSERKQYQDNLEQVIDEETKTIKLEYTGPPINSEDVKIIKSVNNWVEPHILDNGEKAIYVNDQGQPWDYKKSDEIEINIYANIEYYDSRGGLQLGYVNEGQEHLIEQFNIEKEKNINFKIPRTGQYSFYLICTSSDPIIIETISINGQGVYYED